MCDRTSDPSMHDVTVTIGVRDERFAHALRELDAIVSRHPHLAWGSAKAPHADHEEPREGCDECAEAVAGAYGR